ncbi:MAG: hypothetical protein E6K60_03220 [Nitrospirae bacterium]|nr:MAG: hypothetical protein E6K60_03220 [Nitrospirota bacterium]
MKGASTFAVILLLLSACAQSAHQSGLATFDKFVPAELQKDIDRSISYSEIKTAPQNYTGRTVMLGGIVLNAKRLQDRTEIEILQLPLNPALAPITNRSQSQGRFLAVQKEFLDPAILPKGTPVTVIGKVEGSTVKPFDQANYEYPVLEVKNITDWGRTQYAAHYPGYRVAPYPYYGGYYPYGYYDGFYGPYGWGPYGYYPGYLVVPSRPAPAPPPPSQTPPQFKK